MTCTSIGSRGSIIRFRLSPLLHLAAHHPPHPLLLLPPLLLHVADAHQVTLAGCVLLTLTSEAEVEATKSDLTRSLRLIVPRTADSTGIAAKKRCYLDQNFANKSVLHK